MSLILIGYRRSEFQPDWPDPAQFVDPALGRDERDTVSGYLAKGSVVVTYMGYSTCRLCGKRDNGDSELTDGVYVWPEGLAHYVTEHGVRLPRRFVDHVIARDHDLEVGPASYDTTWWKTAEPDCA